MDTFEDDPFEQIINLNTNVYKSGFSEGETFGKKAAITSGFKIGKMTALNIGSELGQYYGVCELFKNQQLLTSQFLASPTKNEKHLKLATQLIDLIENFNIVDCHNESFVINMNQIRDKFKQFCSITNLKNYVIEQDISRAKLNF